MSQLPLFAQASETVLIDDARGRILYTPDFLPAEIARAWFDEVRGAVAWEAQRRRMYDREIDVPRLVGHFPLVPEDAHVPDAIRAAARRVIAATGVAFTSVGLNFYRDGRDSGVPHRAAVPGGHAPHDDPHEGGAPASLPCRPRRGEPAPDELRDAAPLHARRPEDEGARRSAHQPRLSGEAGGRLGRARRALKQVGG